MDGDSAGAEVMTVYSAYAHASTSHTWMPRLLISYRDRMAARAVVSSSALAAAELFATTDGGRWSGYLDRYEEVVSLVSSQKKRSKGESLELLDKWYVKGSTIGSTVVMYTVHARCMHMEAH